jgi:hypothetical protein
MNFFILRCKTCGAEAMPASSGAVEEGYQDFVWIGPTLVPPEQYGSNTAYNKYQIVCNSCGACEQLSLQKTPEQLTIAANILKLYEAIEKENTVQEEKKKEEKDDD